MLRFGMWLALGFAAILLVLLVAGAITESVLESRERSAYPPPGRLIDVGGHRLHIHCEGPTGPSPTVILDAGGTAFSTTWALIQPEAAKTARVCSYDRGGMGWSESGPLPRNGQTAAQELHALLLHSGEVGPFLLVGHSYGGIVIRKFFEMYPDDVAGMVFVDPSFPEQRSILSPGELERIDAHIQRLHRLSFMGRVGFSRLYPVFLEQVLPPTGYELYDTVRSWPRHIRASAHELERMDESLGDPAFESQDFGDRPMIVLSENAGPDRDRLRFKREEHRRLANRSTRGIHIVVDGASHISFVTDPGHAEVVVTAINEVLTVSRQPARRSLGVGGSSVTGHQ
jgi:pimeloyl-ACP methyl ester carboxylesterase